MSLKSLSANAEAFVQNLRTNIDHLGTEMEVVAARDLTEVEAAIHEDVAAAKADMEAALKKLEALL